MKPFFPKITFSLILFLYCFFGPYFSGFFIFAQGVDVQVNNGSISFLRDTISVGDVLVQAYLVEQPLIRVTGSVAVVGEQMFARQIVPNLLPVLNSVSGVRMEERSPGSYRLSLRGSLLRSPFGVQNNKIYMDELPLTDAGGNTYFNLLDQDAISGMTVVKGPDGSLFGANSGGVVLLRSYGENLMQDGQDEIGVFTQFGSYGHFRESIKLKTNVSDKYSFSFNQSYQRANGYRDHSALEKWYFQTQQTWDYRPENRQQLRLFAFYGDLDYETPGGLTLAQFQEDPRASRPGTAAIPGASEQQAGIHNKTAYLGLTHSWYILPHLIHDLQHVVSVFGSHTNFTNPFITNYEQRDEYNLGIRTYFSHIKQLLPDLKWQIHAGLEAQQGHFAIENFDNNQGIPGALQSKAQIDVRYLSTFLKMGVELGERWLIETAISRNVHDQSFQIPAEWMPRLALSYQPSPILAWRASVSRGFSPPTVAEIRPADQLINKELRAETGWSYETGFRLQTSDRRFFADASVFNYNLQDAIVRGVREDGAEYFYNAGEVNQLGFEMNTNAWLIEPAQHHWISGMEWSTQWTVSAFKFGEYRSGTADFSGNQLTGVPKQIFGQSLRLVFPKNVQLNLNYTYTSRIPLNDSNSVYADSYQLLQAKLAWEMALKRVPGSLGLFVAADNILNELYSLGNDINAFGGRYFNAAAPRNYYLGLSYRL